MMQKNKAICLFSLSAFLIMTTILSGCGGDGNSQSSGGAGISLPTEVSAVSANNTNSPSALVTAMHNLTAAVSDLPTDSDYHSAKTAKYVDEKTLEVFGIIETILKAVAQTNYDKAENIGAGPYKAMVAWEEENEGRAQKQLEEWIVQSVLTTENGATVNVVHLWIEEPDQDVVVESRVYRAADQDSAGNYLNYGEWTINANFTNKATGNSAGTFYASAAIAADGKTILQLNENFIRSENIGTGSPILVTSATTGVVNKSNTDGYGKVRVADWDYCWSTTPTPPECSGPSLTLPQVDITYAYNQNYLGFSEDGGTITYKDRNNPVEIHYRYGLFDGTTGVNVEKTKSFGFPVTFTDGNGDRRHAYYGAWQGRHELWAGDQTIPDGTIVTKEDVPPGQTAPTYSVKSFNGILNKRILANADISQIQDIPLEIWLGEGFTLVHNGTDFLECQNDDWNWGSTPPTCNTTPSAHTMATLNYDPNGGPNRKEIIIDRFDGSQNRSYTYNSGTFTETDWSASPGDTSYTPALDDVVHVWISGSTYIKYESGSSSWVELPLTDFDEQTWTPTFDTPVPFTFPDGNEYYVNNKGTNFIVSRSGATYTVKMELQQVANPNNVGAAMPFVAAGTYFKEPWAGATASTFELDTSAASPTYMLLVYRTVDPNTAPDKTIGDLLTQDIWGLSAYDASDTPLADQYNWEYKDTASGDNWGGVTYLMSGSTYVLLDNPIFLDPLMLTPLGGGSSIQFSLQFDGWMHGLPDMHWELEKNNYVMTQELADKVVNIPTGTDVTDSNTGTIYYVKPLEIGVILRTGTPAAGEQPDLSPADGIDLSTVPSAATVNIGAKPTNAQLKYVEGKAVN